MTSHPVRSGSSGIHRLECVIIRSEMDMNGYQALRQHAGIIDLSGRGIIKLTGEDRARLLHAMTTNHIQGLKPGAGCYAFFLTAQGRITADAHVLCFEDHIMVDTEPETRQPVYEHLDKYIIADDVTLEDLTEATATLAVEGPHAEAALEQLGAPRPETYCSHTGWEGATVARTSFTGAPGWQLIVPGEAKQHWIERLQQAGCVPAGHREAHIVRMETGRARHGEDFSEKHIPHETQLLHAVHFTKGCYLGQEIVERVRSRGLVNRLLVRIAIAGEQPPDRETEVLSEGKMVGRVSSAIFSPGEERVFGFAFLRRDALDQPGALTVNGQAAELVANTPLLPV
jgi:tRNA-modifying protein YgfZ